MLKMSFRAFALVAAVALMAVLPARAAIQFQPGLWQETESGSENGDAAKPTTSTDCMTPEDAEDPIKAFTTLKDQAGGHCKTINVKQNGNTINVVMSCGDGKQMSMDMQVTYTFIDSSSLHRHDQDGDRLRRPQDDVGQEDRGEMDRQRLQERIMLSARSATAARSARRSG